MTETSQKPSNWNLPNLLTSLRIVMVPFFGWALLVDGGESATWRTIASVDRPLYSAPSAPCTLFFATSSGHAIAHASVAQTPPLRKPPSSGRAISCGAARSL